MLGRYIRFVGLLMAFLAVVTILPVALHRFLPAIPHDYFATDGHAIKQHLTIPNPLVAVAWNIEYMLATMRLIALELIGTTLLVGTMGCALVSLMRSSFEFNASDTILELERKSDALDEKGVAWAAAAELQDDGTINRGVPLPSKPPGTPECLRLKHGRHSG